MGCSKPASCLLHPGFEGAQLVLQFAVLLTYLVEIPTKLLQLLVGSVTCAQRVSREAHGTLRPGLAFTTSNALKHADSSLFSKEHQRQCRNPAYRLPAIMLNCITQGGDGTLPRILAIEVAILPNCLQAGGSSGTHSGLVRFPSPIDSTRFPEIACDIVDHAILSARGQSTQDAALHKVHPRRTIHQDQELINASCNARFAQGFGSSRLHLVAYVALLQQGAEGLRGTLCQLRLLWRLELSKSSCDGGACA